MRSSARRVASFIIQQGWRDLAPFQPDPPLEIGQSCLQLLLAHGAKIDTAKGDDASLVLATQRGDAVMVSLLLRSGAGPDQTDATGHTALWRAACRDDVAVTALLLAAGANVNAAPADGITPIACAAARGNDAARGSIAARGLKQAHE